MKTNLLNKFIAASFFVVFFVGITKCYSAENGQNEDPVESDRIAALTISSCSRVYSTDSKYSFYVLNKDKQELEASSKEFRKYLIKKYSEEDSMKIQFNATYESSIRGFKEDVDPAEIVSKCRTWIKSIHNSYSKK